MHRRLFARPRQIQRESAAAPLPALQMDMAAEQPSELLGDGQTESCAAIIPARGAIRLMERFENNRLLLFRNADAGIFDREGEPLSIGLLPGQSRPAADGQPNCPLLREFERNVLMKLSIPRNSLARPLSTLPHIIPISEVGEDPNRQIRRECQLMCLNFLQKMRITLAHTRCMVFFITLY